MAVVCTMCKKKQSSLIQNFGLNEQLSQFRFCTKCYGIIKDISDKCQSDLERYEYCVNEVRNADIENRDVLEELNKIITQSEEKASSYKIISDNDQEEKENYKLRVSDQLVTNGFNFENYRIVSYNGPVSGEIVLGTGFISEISATFSDFFGLKSQEFADKMTSAKRAALEKMIINSAEKKGNATIGLNYNYINFTGNMIGVSANGTSVTIEKI